MANELNMTLFGKRLKEARTDRNMTQKELSEKSGVSTVMISAYERSNTTSGKNPALNNIYAIATVLDVSIDWLCGFTDDTKSKSASDVNTEVMLYSIIALLNNDICEIKYGFDNINSGEIISCNFHLDGDNVCQFVSDYLGVKKLVDNKSISTELGEVIIKGIVDKYKNIEIQELITYLPF